MAFDGNRDLLYSRTPVTRNTAVTPLASLTSMASPRRRAPRRKKTAGPRWLSTWPSMTDEPIWPGVAEYLYHAARPALVRIDGTWTVPSALSPMRSSFESTPIAGMRTDTGTERASDSPWDEPPMTPASASDGRGACTWEATARPTAEVPAMISSTPAIPATRARRPTVAGGGAYPACGQETTTRKPAIRLHGASGNVAVPSSADLPHQPNIPVMNWPLPAAPG